MKLGTLSLTATLLGGGCLSINPAHQLPIELAPSWSTSQGPNTTEYLESSSTQKVASGDSTHRDDTEQTWATTTSTPTFGNVGSTSTITDTSTISASPQDGSVFVNQKNGNWRAIRITHDAKATATEIGYSFNLSFDHKKFVQAGAASSGSDLALVFVKYGRGYNLDRFLDPGSSWNSEHTRLWFPARTSLAPGAQSDGEYYLVQGSTQFPAKSDPNGVFLMYDDFADGKVDPQKWTTHTEGSGASGVESIAHGINLHASSLSTTPESRSIKSTWKDSHDGMIAELRFRFPNFMNLRCHKFRPAAFESISDNHVRHGMGISAGKWEHVQYSEAQGSLVTQTLPSMTLDQNWTRFGLAWRGTRQEIWRDKNLELARSSEKETVKTPDNQDLHLRIHTEAKPGNCGGTHSSDINVDWVWIRHYDLPEPQAELLPQAPVVHPPKSPHNPS